MIAIRTENLTKTFGRRGRVVAVKNLTLEVEAGQVFGFLGPNGAGKTTTIRMLLNLIHPTQGDIYLLGRHVRREPEITRQAGAIAEGPAFYHYLSGRRNLEVLARTADCYDPKRIDQLIDQVGLGANGRRRVGGYSLGMKQRLGLAAALLSDPPLLILDEPSNGLDPAGIQEMRRFIRELVDQQGKTVFLSSHLLNEVEQVCDRVAIIRRGEIVREGTVKQLLASKIQVRLEAIPRERASVVLGERWNVSSDGDSALLVDAPREEIPHLVRRLTEYQIDVYQITEQRLSLEEYFLSVTQEERHAEPVPR